MKYYITYTVQGTRPGSGFPLDMLRYAESWPATSVDVEQMSQYLLKPEPIDLCCRSATKKPQLYVERWASFGYMVSNVRVQKV